MWTITDSNGNVYRCNTAAAYSDLYDLFNCNGVKFSAQYTRIERRISLGPEYELQSL